MARDPRCVLPTALMGAGHSAKPSSAHLLWVFHTPQAEQAISHASPFQREHIGLREVDGLAQGHTGGASGSRFRPRSQSPFLFPHRGQRCSFSLVSLLRDQRLWGAEKELEPLGSGGAVRDILGPRHEGGELGSSSQLRRI